MMQYGIITEEGLETVDDTHEGAMQIVDDVPEAGDGQVAAFSRHEVVGGEIHRKYTVEQVPNTSKSQIDRLAEAVAKRILQQ